MKTDSDMINEGTPNKYSSTVTPTPNANSYKMAKGKDFGNASAAVGKPSKGNFLWGSACILIATIFWAVNIPVVKALVPEYMDSNAVTAIRLIGGCVLFWITSLFLKTEKIDRGDRVKLIAGGAVGLFLFIFLLNLSLKYANPIDVSIIMTLPPVFVILIGVIFQKNRPSLLEYIGIVVAFAGAVVVILRGSTGKSGSDNLLGELIALASTLCYSVYLVVTEKPSRKYRPVSMLRWTFLFAAIPSLLLLGSFEDFHLFQTHNTAPWIESLFILICPSFLAYFFLSPALKSIGSELVSIYQYLLPVFATIASVLMGLDKLHWLQVVAMLIIIAGMLLTNIAKRRRQRPQSA